MVVVKYLFYNRLFNFVGEVLANKCFKYFCATADILTDVNSLNCHLCCQPNVIKHKNIIC